jgi:Ca2+-binding EF-hand superfamily protein
MHRRPVHNRILFLSITAAFACSTLSLAATPTQLPSSGQMQAAGSTAPKPGAPSQPVPLTRDQMTSKLTAQFRAADTNHDGYLSQAEIAAVLAARQAQIIAGLRRQREAAFLAMDTNKDGQLSREEFLAGGPKVVGVPDGSKAMKRLDLHNDGKITLNEYLTVFLSDFDKANESYGVTTVPGEGKKEGKKKGSRK